MTGNTGNTGNVGNAGTGGGNATSISTGWFFADREDLPFVTEHGRGGFIAHELRPIERFGERNWSADWFAYRVLIQFGLGHLQDIQLEAPPNSEETAKEIAELVRAAQNERSDALGEIIGESTEFISYFMNLLMATPSSYPQTVRVLKAANLIATVYQMHFKDVYQRARPTQVCPALFPPIAVPGHASYPSGHSTQAHLLALCLGDVFGALPPGQPSPKALIADLDVLARRIARNREIAGLHYPSDSKAGETLAQAIHGLLNATNAPALYKDAVAGAAKEWTW
jgi:membrane-associated phospholipid phosphatase